MGRWRWRRWCRCLTERRRGPKSEGLVRVESVLDQVKKVQSGKSMYVGNINYYHRPLRSGKWSVTYEVRLYFL